MAASDELKGKVAVVTGAVRGIGRCAAIALAQAGADVALRHLRYSQRHKYLRAGWPARPGRHG